MVQDVFNSLQGVSLGDNSGESKSGTVRIDLGSGEVETISSEFATKENLDRIESLITSGRTSQLLYWEVENFCQYKKERFDMSKDGVLSLKGFNSTGKTNAMRALDYCLTTTGASIMVLKNLIRFGERKARIATYWSDGVRITYHLSRVLSKGKWVSFKNGYTFEVLEDGVYKELYNTKVNGSWTSLKTTPTLVKRYFNLAELDGHYLNYMKKNMGMLVLEQTPASLNRLLVSALNNGGTEDAIKRMDSDNKADFSALVSSYERIRLLSNDIDSLDYLDGDIVDSVDSMLSIYNRDNELGDILGKLDAQFKSLSSMRVYPLVDGYDSSTLGKVLGILSNLGSLGTSSTYPVLEGYDSSVLGLLLGLVNSFSELGRLHGGVPVVDSYDSVQLSLLISLVGLFSSLGSMVDVPEFEGTDAYISILGLVESLQSNIDKLGQYAEVLDGLSSEELAIRESSDRVLEQLKLGGHPVGVCSHCGHLSLTMPFTVGASTVSGHTHG